MIGALCVCALVAGCGQGTSAVEATMPPVPTTPPAAAPSPAPPTDPVTAPTPAPGTTRPAATPATTPAGTVCIETAGCFGPPERAGAFDASLVPEASGLVASAVNPGVLWLLDDAPGTDVVWAMRTTGELLGAVTVEGLDARDTESLALGPCEGGDARSCVYVGDIGDNLRRRSDIVVHRFEEPDLRDGVPAAPVPAQAVRLTYPDGAHDAEALLVDDTGALLVITKAPFDPQTGRTGEARLYVAEHFADGPLVDYGVVPVPQPSQPLHSLVVGNVVTGADARAGRVLMRTYDQVLLYVAPERSAPLRSFPSWPVHEVPGPLEPQSEAITWTSDGCGYYTVGEQVGDVWFVPCFPRP